MAGGIIFATRLHCAGMSPFQEIFQVYGIFPFRKLGENLDKGQRSFEPGFGPVSTCVSYFPSGGTALPDQSHWKLRHPCVYHVSRKRFSSYRNISLVYLIIVHACINVVYYLIILNPATSWKVPPLILWPALYF